MNKQIYSLLLTLTYLTILVHGSDPAAPQAHTSYLADMSIGCVADLQNYYFNLKGLTKEIKL